MSVDEISNISFLLQNIPDSFNLPLKDVTFLFTRSHFGKHGQPHQLGLAVIWRKVVQLKRVPSSRVIFSERLYGPLCQSQDLTTALAPALIVSPWPSWTRVFKWRKVCPVWRVTRPLEKDEARIPIVTGTCSLKKGEARFRWVTLLAELTFCFSCKLFATYVGKCRKSWLYRQGSSGRRQSSPYKQGLCKAKPPFFATSLHKSLSFHFSNGKKKACQFTNYTSVFAVFIELRCQYQFCCFTKWMFFTLFINGTLKSMTVNIWGRRGLLLFTFRLI